ncbi:MAG: nucleotidyltransferase family protein [Candidatus Scalindua sp.]
MKYGLKERDIKYITESIKAFSEIKEVVLFGSRAKGKFKTGSDVDMAIKGEDITHSTVTSLSYLLNEEKPLPYYFDIVHYEKIKEPELKEHIDRVGIAFYESKKVTSDG